MDANAAAAPEVLGNTTDAKMFLRFQYCGAWGYKPHVLKAIEEIEKTDLKGLLQYHLHMDQGKTGRNEVTLFTDAACTGEGALVYSKLQTKKQPAADAETTELFLNMLKEEVSKVSSWMITNALTKTHWSTQFEYGHVSEYAKICDGFSLNTEKSFLILIAYPCLASCSNWLAVWHIS